MTELDSFEPTIDELSDATANADVKAVGDAATDAAAERTTRHRARWQAWAPEALLTVGAFLLFAWALDKNGIGNSYYAAATKSATMSWKNFWYGSFDPGGWITVDKPPLALWLQAVSARAFGFSSWSLLVPSAICGAVAVGLLAATVRRVAGQTAGLVSGGVLALTPAIMAVSRSNNPDATLLLCLAAAAYATQRAISEEKPMWMILAGVCCGFGFLAKLLAAGLVMPGLWGAYLVAGPATIRRRIRDLVLAFGAFVAVAAVWVATVDLLPIGDRPFVGGSTNGTALNLVFGYNGIGRITGNSGPAGGSAPAGFGELTNALGGTTGPLRLFNTNMGDQVMWLVVFALVTLGAGLALAIRSRRRDARTGALIMWGGWFAVTYIVFAFASGLFHNYYVAELAPAVAALCGIGVDFARRHGRVGALVVGATALATIPIELLLLDRVSAYRSLRVLVPVALVAIALAAIVTAVRPGKPQARSLAWLAVAAVAIAVIPAAIWTWNGTRAAQAALPEVRPVPKGAVSGFGTTGDRLGAQGTSRGGGGGLFGRGLPANELRWLETQQHGERWIVAVSTSNEASGAIIDGHSVMAMGGFSGDDPAMTPKKLADFVERGELRFVSVGGGGFAALGGRGSSAVNQAVTKVCTPVPADRWGANATSALYDCAGKAAELRTAKMTNTTPTARRPAQRQLPPWIRQFERARLRGGIQFNELQTCLQQHGENIGNGGHPNFSGPNFPTALHSCAAYLPANTRPGAEGSPRALAP